MIGQPDKLIVEMHYSRWFTLKLNSWKFAQILTTLLMFHLLHFFCGHFISFFPHSIRCVFLLMNKTTSRGNKITILIEVEPLFDLLLWGILHLAADLDYSPAALVPAPIRPTLLSWVSSPCLLLLWSHYKLYISNRDSLFYIVSRFF